MGFFSQSFPQVTSHPVRKNRKQVIEAGGKTGAGMPRRDQTEVSGGGCQYNGRTVKVLGGGGPIPLSHSAFLLLFSFLDSKSNIQENLQHTFRSLKKKCHREFEAYRSSSRLHSYWGTLSPKTKTKQKVTAPMVSSYWRKADC